MKFRKEKWGKIESAIVLGLPRRAIGTSVAIGIGTATAIGTGIGVGSGPGLVIGRGDGAGAVNATEIAAEAEADPLVRRSRRYRAPCRDFPSGPMDPSRLRWEWPFRRPSVEHLDSGQSSRKILQNQVAPQALKNLCLRH